jgi:3-(3-hydroxy-phenyl)propionate hydroxylase
VRGADREGLLDDFLGSGFALVSLPQTAPSLFERLPANLWPALSPKRLAVRAPGGLAAASDGLTTIIDVEGDFSQSMKKIASGLLVVRPDRYVAAHLQAENIEAGIREVEELIADTWN